MTKITSARIEQSVFLIRNQKVMVDYDLASLYGVPTKALLQAVRRNPGRFPSDFVFQLTSDEKMELVTNCDRFKPLKHASRPPHVFTEQGVAMLSSVLKSERAILVNVAIMRTFVKLRAMLADNKDLAKRIEEMEKHYDAKFRVVFDAIRELSKSIQKPRPDKLSAIPHVRGFSKD